MFWGLVYYFLYYGNDEETWCLLTRSGLLMEIFCFECIEGGQEEGCFRPTDSPFRVTLKSPSCRFLRVLRATCLLVGLGFAEQPLCCVSVCFMLVNRPSSGGCQCSHDLTWPQQKRCLMTCANSNPDLLFNPNLHSNRWPHCRFHPKKKKFHLPATPAAGGFIHPDSI